MRYFVVMPEVAGEMGDRTILDSSVHPPVVTHLHCVFDWPSDALVRTFPCYVCTAELWFAIARNSLSGVRSKPVTTDVSYTYTDLHPNAVLPAYVWLDVYGAAGIDDFALRPVASLVVSERALRVLQDAGMRHADITPHEPGKPND